jgi:hypothetical protein
MALFEVRYFDYCASLVTARLPQNAVFELAVHILLWLKEI